MDMAKRILAGILALAVLIVFLWLFVIPTSGETLDIEASGLTSDFRFHPLSPQLHPLSPAHKDYDINGNFMDIADVEHGSYVEVFHGLHVMESYPGIYWN